MLQVAGQTVFIPADLSSSAGEEAIQFRDKADNGERSPQIVIYLCLSRQLPDHYLIEDLLSSIVFVYHF